jgi:hypothetical protein
MEPSAQTLMAIQPPTDRPTTFRTTVHGLVFSDRAPLAAGLAAGDPLLLIPDPPGTEDPAVWVHISAGDPVGHLPAEIAAWLAPWLLRGGRAAATTLRVGGPEDPSWKRLLVEVRVGGDDG